MKLIINLAVLTALTKSVYGASGVYSYDSDQFYGPENWDKVPYDDGTVNECGGSEQSPVAFTDEGCTSYADYEMNAGDCTTENMRFFQTLNGVQAEFLDGCTKPTMVMPSFPDAVYEAAQFHFHMGSEHTIDDVTYGAEMHIVHVYTGDGDCPMGKCYAVIGTKLNPASLYNDPTFKVLLDEWIVIHNDQELRCNNTSNMIMELDALSEPDIIDPYVWNRGDSFFHYQGGLTTPPCSEAVHFNIDDKPLAISVEQYTDLARIILDIKDENCNLATYAHHGFTSRPVQPLNGRIVQHICPVGSEDPASAPAGEPTDTMGDTTDESTTETKASSASRMMATFVLSLAAAIFMGQY